MPAEPGPEPGTEVELRRAVLPAGHTFLHELSIQNLREALLFRDGAQILERRKVRQRSV
jgi:hypothetical protein